MKHIRTDILVFVVMMSLQNTAQAATDFCTKTALQTLTQAQLHSCIAGQYQQAHQRLNQLSQSVERVLRKHAKADAAFATAQQKWLAFRDAECAFQSANAAVGRGQSMLRNACLADLSERRADDLQNMLVCHEHADDPCVLPAE